MKRLIGLCALAAVGLSACTSTAAVRSAPAVSSYAADQSQIDGQWGLLIEAANLPSTFESGEYACSGWSYNVDIESGLRDSIARTMDTAFEGIREVTTMPRPNEMAQREMRGVIVVTVDRGDAFLSWLQGFWSAKARADATLRIGVDIRSATGERIGGFSEGAQRSAEADTGGCEAGSEAIARAMSLAIEDAMEEMLERIQDSTAIRQLPT